MKLPDQMLVEARLPSHALANPGAEVTARLEATLGGHDLAGRRIAVGAGSRGIDRIAEVTFAVVAWLKASRGEAVPDSRRWGATGEGRPRARRSCSPPTASPRPRWAFPYAPPWRRSRSGAPRQAYRSSARAKRWRRRASSSSTA